MKITNVNKVNVGLGLFRQNSYLNLVPLQSKELDHPHDRTPEGLTYYQSLKSDGLVLNFHPDEISKRSTFDIDEDLMLGTFVPDYNTTSIHELAVETSSQETQIDGNGEVKDIKDEVTDVKTDLDNKDGNGENGETQTDDQKLEGTSTQTNVDTSGETGEIKSDLIPTINTETPPAPTDPALAVQSSEVVDQTPSVQTTPELVNNDEVKKQPPSYDEIYEVLINKSPEELKSLCSTLGVVSKGRKEETIIQDLLNANPPALPGLIGLG